MGMGGYQVPRPIGLPSALHMGHNVKSGLRDSSPCSNSAPLGKNAQRGLPTASGA